MSCMPFVSAGRLFLFLGFIIVFTIKHYLQFDWTKIVYLESIFVGKSLNRIDFSWNRQMMVKKGMSFDTYGRIKERVFDIR